MRIHIGPYVRWVGPYQIVDFFLKPFIKDEGKLHNIGSWLSETPISDICQRIYDKNQRKIEVKIDRYDTWSTDHTLALIIHPMLVQLQKTKHGTPFTNDKDVPKNLRSTAAPSKENEWDTDANHDARWDWILNEMIFAFGEIKEGNWEENFHSGVHDIEWEKLENGNSKLVYGPKDTHKFDRKGYDKHLARIINGTTLFGKYYMALWD
jgi:hypothetical protein